MKKLPQKIDIVRNSGRILDIGSGNNPLDIATHLVDMKPNDNDERGGDLEIGNRTFKQGSLENIPYEDQYFDFVHAAHILEHTSDPHKAIAELTRVAPMGYVETPAAVIEHGLNYSTDKVGWDFHHWFVWRFPDSPRLYIQPKTPENQKLVCSCEDGERFHSLMKIAEAQDFHEFVPYDCGMTMLAWSNKIDYEVWEPMQTGTTTNGRCNCAYAAFFAHTANYMRSLRQLPRRRKLKKRYPEIHALFVNCCK
jgi:hypothetical protein